MSRSNVSWAWFFGVKSNFLFSPQTLTSTFSVSSFPTGTSSAGMLGMLRRQSFLMASSSAILASLAAIWSPTPRISLILASFSAPLGIFPISRETAFLVFLSWLFSLVSFLHSPSASRSLSSLSVVLFLFMSMSLIFSGSALITSMSNI